VLLVHKLLVLLLQAHDSLVLLSELIFKLVVLRLLLMVMHILRVRRFRASIIGHLLVGLASEMSGLLRKKVDLTLSRPVPVNAHFLS